MKKKTEGVNCEMDTRHMMGFTTWDQIGKKKGKKKTFRAENEK